MPETATHTPGWKRLSILIVDDERPARSELERMLRGLGHEGPLAQASSVGEALEKLGKTPADLILLDIQMPGGDGFSLLSSLGKNRPPVIFTTAHDRFAARAFEEKAVDYLLKPFSLERLASALSRLSPGANKPSRYSADDTILLKIDGECHLLRVSRIELIESAGNSCTVFWGERQGRVARSLKYLAERLDPGHFFRSSREQLINLRLAGPFASDSSGNLSTVMPSGRRIHFSRRCSALLRARLPR